MYRDDVAVEVFARALFIIRFILLHHRFHFPAILLCRLLLLHHLYYLFYYFDSFIVVLSYFLFYYSRFFS